MTAPTATRPSCSAAAAAVQTVARTLRGPLGAGALIADPVAAAAFEHRADRDRAIGSSRSRPASTARPATTPRTPTTSRPATPRSSRARTRCGRSNGTGSRRPARSKTSPAAVRSTAARSRATTRSRSRCRRSTGSRCAAATRPGLHVLVAGHGLDLADPDVARLIAERAADPLVHVGLGSGRRRATSRSSTRPRPRSASSATTPRACARRSAPTTCCGSRCARSRRARRCCRTRGGRASGSSPRPNAHPLNQEELGAAPTLVTRSLRDRRAQRRRRQLRRPEGARVAAPSARDHDRRQGHSRARRPPDRARAWRPPRRSARRSRRSKDRSRSARWPARSRPHPARAARAAARRCTSGLGDDCFVVASEPYGVVEECERYLRLDGETMLEAGQPGVAGAGRGRRRRAARARSRASRASRTTAARCRVAEAELQTPEITTRDVARGDAAHYLLKEMAEAPASFRKTLRGRIVERDGRLDVRLPARDAGARRSSSGCARARSGACSRSGRGARTSRARAWRASLRDALGARAITIEALTATELSGFELTADMSDTLVVAISQSGTTTDTNRTVDLARARGRGRGRDREPAPERPRRQERRRALHLRRARRRDERRVDEGVLRAARGRAPARAGSRRPSSAPTTSPTARAAASCSPRCASCRPRCRKCSRAGPRSRSPRSGTRSRRRSWAVVGNGVNQIAAHELRIKLSELCYKSIACDVTEDKKHIDLSSEPMVLVCAAGLHGSNADDVAKEVAIYRAHKAAPIVIADDDETRFEIGRGGDDLGALGAPVARVRAVRARRSSVRLRSRARDRRVGPSAARGAWLHRGAGRQRGRRPTAIRSRRSMPTSSRWPIASSTVCARATTTAVSKRAPRCSSHRCCATRSASSRSTRTKSTSAKSGTPSVVVEDLTAALTKAIEELTRPVDAIKHQAKTVTVGISRSDETLLQVPLVREVLATGAARDSLTYRALRTLGRARRRGRRGDRLDALPHRR